MNKSQRNGSKITNILKRRASRTNQRKITEKIMILWSSMLSRTPLIIEDQKIIRDINLSQNVLSVIKLNVSIISYFRFPFGSLIMCCCSMYQMQEKEKMQTIQIISLSLRISNEYNIPKSIKFVKIF
jgi:hypothetical protein